MTDRKSLEAAKKLVRRGAGQEAPSVEAFVPEIRSNIKWKPTTSPVTAFRPEAAVMLVWNYGVPFAQIAGFHEWLATHEVALANLCANLTKKKAQYLGTYLHIDTGSSRYQTLWGLDEEVSAESALVQALANSPQFFDLVKVVRGYWARDQNATDHRYGQARNYMNLENLKVDSAFWDVTKESCSEQPQV